MLQPAQAPPSALERLREQAGPRAFGIALAVLIELVLLLVLLSMGVATQRRAEEERLTIVDVPGEAEQAPAPADAAPTPPSEAQAEPELQPQPAEPLPPQPAQPTTPVPVAPPVLPAPTQTAPPPAPASPALSAAAPARPRRVYGPVDTRGPGSRDTPVVGAAPNGEPLYAASWYREPTEADLRGYMSAANGPGWGLIACRTAPEYRVEDCVALDEYPAGVQINRAVLAAAWQFRVRPPQRGGVPLVGSWVRIRIDYRQRRAPS